MTVEITLPLLGTYQVWLGAILVVVAQLGMIALLIGIHFDNKREGN
jgi:hypothetical protein